MTEAYDQSRIRGVTKSILDEGKTQSEQGSGLPKRSPLAGAMDAAREIINAAHTDVEVANHLSDGTFKVRSIGERVDSPEIKYVTILPVEAKVPHNKR